MATLDLRNSFKIYRKKLDNGLDVVVIPNNKVPIVCVDAAYRVGSKDERFDRTGMAHLFEHLMFEGTKNVKKGEFDRLCSVAGGTNNAYTSFDMTNYYMTLPSNQLDLGLWLEADRMKNFKITQKALKNQQSVVIEEIKQTVEDQPYGLWRELMSSAAYSTKSSYSWEVHGTKEHVASVTLEDAEEFRKQFYQPANACLLIVGDVPVDLAFQKSEEYFSEIPKYNGKVNRNKFKKSHLIHKAYKKFEDDVPTPAVFLAYHCDGFTKDYSNISDILANILGNGRSSHLYKKLIYEKQIASQAGAFVDKREDSSLLIFYAFANTTDISCDVLKENIDSTINEFIKNSIDDREIEKAQNQLTSQLAFEIQSISGIADTVAVQALFRDDPEKVYHLLDSYYEFTKKDIKDFAEGLIKNSNIVRVDAVPEFRK